MVNLHRPKHILSYLIWGGWYGSRNIGDSAILLGLKELIHNVNKGKEVYIRVLSTDVDYTSTHGVTGKRALIKSDIFKILPWFNIIQVFRESDRVIISGGTPIFDFSHAIRTLYFFLPIVFRKPYYFFGIGVKPIKSFYGKKYIPYVLRKSKHISVRDEGSQDILRELGLPNDKINLTADSALFAKPASQDEINSVLRHYDIKENESTLIIAPRFLSSERKKLYLQEHMDLNTIQSTPSKIANTVNAINNKFDKIIFFAMHYYGPDSDVPLIKEIISHCNSKKIIFINEGLHPRIAIGILQKATLVIGMRLHSLILSASMGTPAVAISYEQKVNDFMKRINLNEYCIDLFDFSANDLIKKVNKALNNQTSIRQRLEQKVNHLRVLATKDAKMVLKV
jgi:polysaccharide pyruvyl transferase WcaK-like protein